MQARRPQVHPSMESEDTTSDAQEVGASSNKPPIKHLRPVRGEQQAAQTLEKTGGDAATWNLGSCKVCEALSCGACLDWRWIRMTES